MSEEETTRNFYRENRYTHQVIADFVRSQKNIEQYPRIHAKDVKKNFFFSDVTEGSIDLFYRFTDSFSEEQAQFPPALGFRSTTKYEEYELVYIDPSLEQLWKQYMDREVT